MTTLPYLFGTPVATATLRSCPEDFQVFEDLGFQPSGDGQHMMLEVEKRLLNSDWVASKIARLAGVKKRDVGMAGLKDRHAVTRQWFSVDFAGKAPPDWQALQEGLREGERLEVLQAEHHHRKIRRGALKGNRFQLLLRDVEGARTDIESRLQQIQQRGVPNYFGEQRFGRGGANVEKGRQMFQRSYRPKGRHERGLLLSAVRSELFNQICAARIEQDNWDTPLEGEVCMLDRKRARFVVEPEDSAIQQRLQEHEIHLTAPLWGRGALESYGGVAELEQAVAAQFPELTEGLEQAGLEQDRRSLRLLPDALQWKWLDEGQLQLNFWLPAGSYATTLLRELVVAEVATDK